jgi:hypothetical protein
VDVVDWAEVRRDAAHRLLTWDDTAVIEDTATLLVFHRSVESMAFVCEALAMLEPASKFEEQETILWALSSAWQSGEVDVPSLVQDVLASGGEGARAGAAIALDWLRVDT